MIYRGAIFDLDGTLTDTLEDLHVSVNGNVTLHPVRLAFSLPKRIH